VNAIPADTMLVCFAMKEEAGAFQRASKANPDVTILVTGIGKANTEKSVRDSFARRIPKAVLTCGFAGGLDPELESGTVVFATEDGSLATKLSSAGAKRARFFCAARIATTGSEKLELRRTTGADAVEMESEFIQALCHERAIPCATVRVISDAANDDLPLDFNKLANPDLSLNYGKLAWAIANAPGKIPALMRLQKVCRVASGNLARVLKEVTAAA
jgi:nucleoside phosphorylase